jgi:hypothetical protein
MIPDGAGASDYGLGSVNEKERGSSGVPMSRLNQRKKSGNERRSAHSYSR